MAQSKTSSGKKEKLFHPKSRKAGQLERKQLRSAKLQEAAAKRAKKDSGIIDRHSFFVHALPPDVEALTLPEVHDLIIIWLTRNDQEIESEKAARRKGRPPSAKELRLIQLKERETEEYRTGMEMLDLTHSPNVNLMKRWRRDDMAFLEVLRYIRVSSESPLEAVISRPGKHQNLMPPDSLASLQISSTIQAMDDIQ